MLWVDAPHAGFTPPGSEPWLPILQNYAALNAATQAKDPRSLLTLYRTLLHLRRQHDTLHSGEIAEVSVEGTLLRYRRVAVEDGHSTDFLVLLNFGDEPVVTQVPRGTVLVTTILDGAGATTECEQVVEGNEGILIALG